MFYMFSFCYRMELRALCVIVLVAILAVSSQAAKKKGN